MSNSEPYEIVYKVVHEYESKTTGHHIQIGSASMVKNGDGSVALMCTLESIPIGWNGEFKIRPSRAIKKTEK